MVDTSCLVFWKDTEEISILKKSETKVKPGRKREGEIQHQAKWDGKWYDDKILAENSK